MTETLNWRQDWITIYGRSMPQPRLTAWYGDRGKSYTCLQGGRRMNKYLQGRTAIVTGASRRQGIGAAICHKLAQAGANICFTYWQAYDRTMPWGAEETAPQQLQQELEALGIQATGLETLPNLECVAQ